MSVYRAYYICSRCKTTKVSEFNKSGICAPCSVRGCRLCARQFRHKNDAQLFCSRCQRASRARLSRAMKREQVLS